MNTAILRLTEVESQISSPTFFDFLQHIDLYSELDARDEADFDDRWMAEYHRLEQKRFHEEINRLIDRLRELAFKGAYRAVQDADAAARVSDDMELVAKSMALGEEERESWSMAFLWEAYRQGTFLTRSTRCKKERPHSAAYCIKHHRFSAYFPTLKVNVVFTFSSSHRLLSAIGVTLSAKITQYPSRLIGTFS